MTKRTILQMLDEAGGATTDYPFIETGREYMLNDLVTDGLLIRIARQGDLDEIRITEKGREFLSKREKG